MNLDTPFSLALRFAGLSALAFALSNCTAIPEDEHFFLTKENMLFEKSLMFQDESLAVAVVEPGSNDASGAGGTGCATCQ